MLKTESNKKNYIDEILFELEKMFPDAGCELNYNNLFELSVAVMLSAQTTDKKVNLITPILFTKYPNAAILKNANINDVHEIIKPLGLANNKSKNVIAFSKIIDEEYNGNIPNDFHKLIELPGIGRKTANVILSEGFGVMRIAVDTHVERVSKRLGLSNIDSTVLQVEEDLMKLIKENMWHRGHHLLLFFGRYFCKAQKPNCKECPFIKECIYKNNRI